MRKSAGLCFLLFWLCLLGNFKEIYEPVKAAKARESCSWREETWIAHKISAFGCCREVNWSHYDIMAESVWSAKLSVFDGRGIYWHDVARVPAGFSFCQRTVDTAKCLLLPRTTARVEKAADQYYERVICVWLSNVYWSFGYGCVMLGNQWLRRLKYW